MTIHSANNAFVDPQARIEDDVTIGPFCVIGPDVSIGCGTRLENSVTVTGDVAIGEGNHIHPNVVLGGAPQDLSYQGSPTKLIIGDRNVIRENVTINRGSEKESGVTVVGNHCFLMAGCHVAHDCFIGDHVVIANDTMLGGHVHIRDHATLSGLIGVHHFSTDSHTGLNRSIWPT